MNLLDKSGVLLDLMKVFLRDFSTPSPRQRGIASDLYILAKHFPRWRGLGVEKYSYVTIFLLLPLLSFSQNTLGLLSIDGDQTLYGFNLIYPHNQPHVYLLDNCGRIVHRWEDDDSFRPGNTAYLLEDGKLIKTKRPASVAGNPIWAGGGGATVEIRDWDNTLLWSFTLNDSTHRLHHDIEPMPNGNILMIVWEKKSLEEVVAAGRDTSNIPDGELWPDYIIEVKPIGTDSAEIVWEWHVWDHLIQDFDSTKANFGIVSDHPERVDINWDTSEGIADWMHTNAIDYESDLDQIVLSVPTFNEIWIIDHSTSAEEAASHTGGFSGVGGDLMYRWGNPLAYKAGDSADQTLFYQHDIHWADLELDGSHPHKGKLVVFNNRVGEDYSTVNIFNPVFDTYEWEYTMTGNRWGPEFFDWTYQTPDSTTMYSSGLSSVQLLPNENTFICVGRKGYSFEINPAGEVVWEYITPLINGNPVSQGTNIPLNGNLTFQMKRYSTDYPAFLGKDLSPKGFIETNPDTSFCSPAVAISAEANDPKIQIYPNPAREFLVLERAGSEIKKCNVFDLQGRKIFETIWEGERLIIETKAWADGIYMLRLEDGFREKIMVLGKK